jgi:CDP-paratose 2-epimerase
MREAIQMCEEIVGRPMNVSYVDQARSGDHIWYVSDVRKFRRHYPEWEYRHSLSDILSQLFAALRARLE